MSNMRYIYTFRLIYIYNTSNIYDIHRFITCQTFKTITLITLNAKYKIFQNGDVIFLIKYQKSMTNIARGTTDPGY